VIEQTRQGERREGPGDRAVPEMGGSCAPVTPPDGEQNGHHDGGRDQAGETQLGADEERHVVDRVEHGLIRRDRSRGGAEVSGAHAAERMGGHQTHGGVDQAESLGRAGRPQHEIGQRTGGQPMSFQRPREDRDRGRSAGGEAQREPGDPAGTRPAHPYRAHRQREGGSQQSGTGEGQEQRDEEQGQGNPDERPVSGASTGRQAKAQGHSDREVSGQHVGVGAQPVHPQKLPFVDGAPGWPGPDL